MQPQQAGFPVRLHTFGGLWLDDGAGRCAGARSRRGLACLALLAAQGDTGMPRYQAAALLWPDQEPRRARRALNQLLYTLRHDLGAAVFADGNILRLDPAILASDVTDLLGARRWGDPAGVATAYTGPFLDGFHLDQAGAFERWSAEERSRFQGLAGDALVTLAARAEAEGDLSFAIEQWRRRATLDPLEALWVIRLMDALARFGDVPAAVQCAAGYQARIREELELGPDPEVAACADRLRQVHTAPRPSIPSPLPQAAAVPSTVASAGVRPVLPSAAGGEWLRRLALAGVTLALAGWSTWRHGHPTVAAPPSLRVAVAPFVNQGNDTTLTAFGDLAASWISGGLLDSGRFEVVDPRTMSRPVERLAADSDLTLARRAGAARLLRGRFTLTHDSLQVVLSVTGTADGRELDSLHLTTAATTELARVGALLTQQAVAVLNRTAVQGIRQ